MTKPAYTYKQRLKLLEEVYKKGVTVAQACREFGVSRFTFYKWAKRYNPKASIKVNLASLRNKTRKIKRFAGQAPSYIEQEVKRIAANNPSWSKYKIASELERSFGKGTLGTHGVYNILKRAGINTLSARERWREFVLKSKKRILTPQERLEVIRRAEDLGVPVAQVCRDFGISRFTFYKWKRRWDEKGTIDALRDVKPLIDRLHLRVKPRDVNAILSLVVEFPKLSKYEIASKIQQSLGPVVGVHGVYNVLKRHGLSTPEARLAYAEVRVPVEPIQVAPTFTDKVRYVFNQFVTGIAPARPGLATIWNFVKVFTVFSVLSFAVVYSSFWWIGYITSRAPSIAIGTIFATIALTSGMLFFLYSLKYYLSLAIVLSFSQQEPGFKERELRKKSIFSWILGLAWRGNGNGDVGLRPTRASGPVGLTPNLEHVTLKRYPKVSVHIPLYNEKKVVERILNAVTSFDYPGPPAGGYEVIIADDSTDETTEIIEDYLKSQNSNVRTTTQNSKLYTLTTAEVREGVVLKHLHRTSRQGFKGGALREALKHTDPEAEFISVFDADFVPYPDTLELFLKYFQATAGTLDTNKLRMKIVRMNANNNIRINSHDISNSHTFVDGRIAAIQGYQWHVLNKSENWITRGVRSEYAGSYVIERSGGEIYSGLKMISGSVYMIRRDVLDEIGWETSITEDFQLTLKLYEKGYKVVYTPYIQAPAECVSTLKRLIRQRMRWAEGHSNNIKRMFTRLILNPKLTFSEKLEFLYLSPYYLQSFFFLIGTISWLISETLFPARLPFWTSLWGWSLVLTNFLSLPLMNAVGLFLEESEEKDYSGLLSFVTLSYLLVPFQAYASLKGFLQKEEGPWFRTPKTGRITDIITRGRFYRLIAGILPGRAAPAVSPMEANAKLMKANKLMDNSLIRSNSLSISSYSRYVALATANSRFDSFSLKSKNIPWIGKTLLVVFLIISITLVSLSSFIGLEPEKEDRRINLPKIMSEKSGFKIDEQPSFILDIGNSSKNSNSLASEVEAYSEPEVNASVYFNDEKISLPIEIEQISDGLLKLKIEPNGNIQPGKYEVRAVINQGKESVIASESFVWGVLAINTNKSIYLSGETAYLQFSALNDQGSTLCKAPLELRIKTPKGETKVLSTEEGTISFSDNCDGNNVTDEPDSYAYYKLEELGRYELTLRNQANGYEISDSFEVRDSVPFDIERIGATRINPYEAEYQMRIKIKANQDFEGKVAESLPEGFEIAKNGAFSVERLGEVQKIAWEVHWRKGENYELSYIYQAPKESPKVYLLGPLTLRSLDEGGPSVVFQETRRWQIAVDQAANVYTAESLTTSSTTLTTLQNKVTLNFTPASTAEHWVVVATGEVRRNDAAPDVSSDGAILGRFALSLDGTVIPVTPYAGYAGSGAGVTGGNHTAWKTFQVFRKITGFNTQRTAIVQWSSETGAATEIRNARILAFRIPNEASANIQYVESLSVVNDTVNPTSALTLTWTPSSAGDYVLMAQGFHHEGPGGATNGGLFWVDEGTEATNTDDSYIGQNEPGVPFFHVQRKNLTAASHTFILRHKPDIISGSERFGLAILAFRADVFDNTETSEALTTTTTTSTTYQNKINFTVATAASARDHVFLGAHTPDHATSDTNDGRYGRWLLNSVEITEEAPAQLRGGYLKSQGLAWTLNTVGGIAVQAQFRSPDGVITASDRQARLVVLRYPGANATQIHYRWRNDNGDEVDTGDGADGALAPAGAFNLNTDESGGRTYPDGIAYRVVAPADLASSVSQYSASDDFQGIAAGDEVLLINMQGTSTDNADVGNYEFMEVQSVTSTTITFATSISKSFNGTTASNQKVVVQRVPNYTSVTLDSTDSLTASAWDGLSACSGGAGASCRLTGMVAFRATGTVSVGTGTSITVAGRGYRLGSGVASGDNIRGSQGESYTGAGTAATSTANGGGGGGGELTNVGVDACGGGGAGGGYAASGSSGGYGPSCGGALPANGPGATYGSADLSKIFLGSGGGGGGKDEHSVSNCPSNPASGDGANGGGIVIAFANTISVSGSVSANGNNGSTAPCLSDNGNGGGGTGGSVYLAAVNATLGTNLVTATAGSGAASGGTWNGAGGNGGTGRIRVETGSVTSVTTNPSASLSANAPAGATFAFAQDTKYDFIPKNTIKRLRFEVSNEGGASTGALTYQLQVAQTATCSSGTYAAVLTDTSGHWQIVASSYITDSDPTANIHVAGTQALTDENTTFVKGQLKDTGNTTGSITLATTEFTEIEFAVQALTAAVDNANYCFRLTNINTYTQYGEAVIVPERLWLMFGLGPILPVLFRRRDKKITWSIRISRK